MKKWLLLVLICVSALSTNAQRCAVMEFKAGVGVSQSDVDGVEGMFTTGFRPAGYTVVEREQIDRIIKEQQMQRSKLTESQMVRIGQILNLSCIVIGDINKVRGEYNVDVRVVNVESGAIIATAGKSFSASSSYGEDMRGLARNLASKIAITSNKQPTEQSPLTTSKCRTSVEVVCGYLKVFPKELGSFESEPSSVIAQINKQVQYGYNNWRVPTKEELALLRANGYLGGGQYMALDRRQFSNGRYETVWTHGIVLLVTDGDDYATIQKAEEARKAEELKAQGLVDLGLPSGTLWKDKNEEGGFYTYDQAVAKFGNSLPTYEQLCELKTSCRWTWTGNGYKVEGPSGASIFLPAAGAHYCDGSVSNVGSVGCFWSSTPHGSERAWQLYFNSSGVGIHYFSRCDDLSVRLVR